MPIFTRSFDLLSWLLPASQHFPRVHRHGFTRRLLDAAFDLRERLEEADVRQGRVRGERLAQADEALARLRVYLRLARLSRDQLDASVESWESHASYGNTAGLRKSILRSVAYPLGAC